MRIRQKKYKLEIEYSKEYSVEYWTRVIHSRFPCLWLAYESAGGILRNIQQYSSNAEYPAIFRDSPPPIFRGIPQYFSNIPWNINISWKSRILLSREKRDRYLPQLNSFTVYLPSKLVTRQFNVFFLDSFYEFQGFSPVHYNGPIDIFIWGTKPIQTPFLTGPFSEPLLTLRRKPEENLAFKVEFQGIPGL